MGPLRQRSPHLHTSHPIERPNPLERLVTAFAGASARRWRAEAMLAPAEGALSDSGWRAGRGRAARPPVAGPGVSAVAGP